MEAKTKDPFAPQQLPSSNLIRHSARTTIVEPTKPQQQPNVTTTSNIEKGINNNNNTNTITYKKITTDNTSWYTLKTPRKKIPAQKEKHNKGTKEIEADLLGRLYITTAGDI